MLASATVGNYADLWISLHAATPGAYLVELQLQDPNSDLEMLPVRGGAQFDLDILAGFRSKFEQYGAALSHMLFADERLKAEYRRAMDAAQDLDVLRIRLIIGPSAPDLQKLRWELLTAPDSGAFLATAEKVVFSRFMSSQYRGSLRPRRKAEMRAVIAAADPANLPDGLAAVPAKEEAARAQEALQWMKQSTIGVDQPLSIDSLLAALREPADVLYLVCHGAFQKKPGPDQGPQIFLEKGDGDAPRDYKLTRGRDLANAIAGLIRPPRLILLASCESAGTEDNPGEENSETMTALAQLLANAGVPAVIAMRGKITMESVRLLVPTLFTELERDGRIDRAMAAARRKLTGRWDFWMPALYLRLKGGQLWYQPGFAAGSGAARIEEGKWESIVRHVRLRQFVAITGDGIGEEAFGEARDLALELAVRSRFPLSTDKRSELAGVMQYINFTRDQKTAVRWMQEGLKAQLLKKYPDIAEQARQLSLPKLLTALIEREATIGGEAYRLLAGLDGSIYVTATPDDLLYRALAAGGRKKPAQLLTAWRPWRPSELEKEDDTEGKPVTAAETPTVTNYQGTPSPTTPVVYQMLGAFGPAGKDTLVLTEDDHFDFAITMSRYRLVPGVVRHALVSCSLLFLGFQLTDWSFRVLFRLIRNLPGRNKSAGMTHVGVQVDPSEHDLADIEKARTYLQDYFGKEADIAIYWGTPLDFLRTLRQQLDTLPNDEPAPLEEDSDEWSH